MLNILGVVEFYIIKRLLSVAANNVGFHSIYVSSADKQLMADYRVFVPRDPFYNGCNDHKTCFGSPGDCVASADCDAVVAVLVQGSRYQFELKAKAAGYVAVGLSDDRFMVCIIWCLKLPTFVSVCGWESRLPIVKIVCGEVLWLQYGKVKATIWRFCSIAKIG